MRTIIAVFAALSVGVLSQAFATDPPVVEATQPTTPPPASTSVNSSDTFTPTPAKLPADGKTTATDGTKTVRLIIGDAAADARMKRLLAAGYKPEAHGDEVVFCRRETVLGTKFQRKVCNTAEQLESVASTGRDEVEQMQRVGMRGVPTGH